MGKRRFATAFILIALILVLAVMGVRSGYALTERPSEGYIAPNFRLADINGKTFELKKVVAGNKVTLVNFWATWCPPCRAEIPEFIKFYNRYSGKRVAVLAVNLQEDPKTVKKFATGAGMIFPVLTDTAGRVGNKYQIFAIPTTFIIDRKGKIRGVIKGSTSLDVLESKVKSLLKEK